MYQFQISNQADVMMTLDLSAVFFALIDQQIINQSGPYQGVIPLNQLPKALESIDLYLRELALYHDFLRTETGAEYLKLKLEYHMSYSELSQISGSIHKHLQQVLTQMPSQIHDFLRNHVNTLQQRLRIHFKDFYRINKSPEDLLLSPDLKKRLFWIIDMLNHALKNKESVMFKDNS
jgi:hypothetical protein